MTIAIRVKSTEHPSSAGGVFVHGFDGERSRLIDYIAEVMEKLEVTSYDVHPDGTVDSREAIVIPDEYKFIPVKFGKVHGYFDVSHTKITTLKNAPKWVAGGFYCQHADITSLEGCPQYVGGGFVMHNTDITSLEGCPQYVGGYFDCGSFDSSLTAILPILKVKGLTSILHSASRILMRHYKKDGTGDIIALQDDLIEAGFGNIARLRPC